MAGEPIEFDYEITLVGDERGKRLAAKQANAVLEVLEWFGRPQQPPDTKPQQQEQIPETSRENRSGPVAHRQVI